MSSGESFTLLSNASATGSEQRIIGGDYCFQAEATFGGGHVKLQMVTKNGTFIDVPNADFTANNMVVVTLPPGIVKAAVSTATAVYAYLTKVAPRF